MQIELTELEVRFALLGIGASVDEPILTPEMGEALEESVNLIPDSDNEEQIQKLFPDIPFHDARQRAEFYERHTASAMRKLAAALKGASMKQLSEKQELNLLIVAWASALAQLSMDFDFNEEETKRARAAARYLDELKSDPDMQDVNLIHISLEKLETLIAKRKEMK